MNTFFSNKCILLLIRGTISLLILSTMVVEFINTPMVTQAKMSQTQPNISQAFKHFCFWYYNDGQDSNAARDTHVCQNLSSSFSSLLKQDAPKGYKQWSACSLHDLARKGLLINSKAGASIKSSQGFVKSIANSELRALVSGSGNNDKNIPQDSDFLPNLWDYHATLDTTTDQNIPTYPNTLVTTAKVPLSVPFTSPYEPVTTDINPSSIGARSNQNVYQKALNVFCHLFQNDVTSYLYGSTTADNLASVVSALRSSRSISILAQDKGAGIAIPFADIFERGELKAAQQAIDTSPDGISQCPGAEPLSQAKPFVDDFVIHKMSSLTVSQIDSILSNAVLFDSQARIQ